MSEPGAAPIIGLEDVRLTLGDHQALRDVTVSFREGTSTVIMGPSGCGKSTLLKVAAGLIPPDGGRVLFRGRDLFLMSERALRDMRRINGYVFQDGALWENKTLFENLSLPLEVQFPRMDRTERERRVIRALERVGLQDSVSARPAALSGGERKIASFLRALVVDPALVFLDEPTLSIDHELADRISLMIRELKGRGRTVIAVTHDAALTSILADRLVVMDNGAVIAEGEFNEVKRTSDMRARAILAEVLGEISSFDTDVLSLLDGEN